MPQKQCNETHDGISNSCNHFNDHSDDCWNAWHGDYSPLSPSRISRLSLRFISDKLSFIDYFTSEIDIQEPFVLSFSVQCIYWLLHIRDRYSRTVCSIIQCAVYLLITSHPRSIFKNRSFYHSVCSVFIDYFTSEIDIQEPFVLSFSVQCVYSCPVKTSVFYVSSFWRRLVPGESPWSTISCCSARLATRLWCAPHSVFSTNKTLVECMLHC